MEHDERRQTRRVMPLFADLQQLLAYKLFRFGVFHYFGLRQAALNLSQHLKREHLAKCDDCKIMHPDKTPETHLIVRFINFSWCNLIILI